MDVRFASVLVLEVLVGIVGVAKGGVGVLVVVARAEVVEPARHAVVVVGHVIVLVRVRKLVVVVFLRRMTGCVSHLASFRCPLRGRSYTHIQDVQFLRVAPRRPEPYGLGNVARSNVPKLRKPCRAAAPRALAIRGSAPW